MKICFATHNQNKLKEIKALLPERLELISLSDIDLTEEIPETGSTLEENSRIKAEHIYLNYGIPVFADDTGLEVNALNGEPGVYSARYAGGQRSDQDNMSLLLKNLDQKQDRSALFKTVITLITDKEDIQFTGVCEGRIAYAKAGDQGFGYDPIFIPENSSLTFAQMNMDQKNAISHRKRAFEKLIVYLQLHYR